MIKDQARYIAIPAAGYSGKLLPLAGIVA